MEVLIVVGLIAFFVIGYLQNKAKNAPFDAIDKNEVKASEHKEKLIKRLKEAIEFSLKYLEKKDLSTQERKDSKEALKEKSELLNMGIQQFENQYIQMKERFKFDLEEQVKASIDYCDWFYHYADFYDPIRGELWYEDGWEERRSALTKIKEIEKRMKAKTE